MDRSGCEKGFAEGVDTESYSCRMRLPDPEQRQRFRSIIRRFRAATIETKSLTDQKVGVEYAALVERKRTPNRSLTNWNQVIRVGACEWLDDRKIVSLTSNLVNS